MTRALVPYALDRETTDQQVEHALSKALWAADDIERSREHVDDELPQAAEAIRRLRKAAKHLRRALGELRTWPGCENR